MVINSTTINQTKKVYSDGQFHCLNKESLNSDGQQFHHYQNKENLNMNSTNINKTKKVLISDGQQFHHYQQNFEESLISDGQQFHQFNHH